VQVIDNEDDRGLRSGVGDQLEDGERDERPLGRGVDLGEAERGLQRRAVPRRKPVSPVQNGAQQPLQRSESQMGLLLGATDR
jgi:hypothetical protein